MPPKENLVYIGHMLDNANKAVELIKGKTRDDFDNDEVLFLALAHLVQIIGESARRLSKQFCETHTNIPWKAIIGMRHKVVHDYMDIDANVLWDTVTKELPPLIKDLNKITE